MHGHRSKGALGVLASGPINKNSAWAVNILDHLHIFSFYYSGPLVSMKQPLNIGRYTDGYSVSGRPVGEYVDLLVELTHWRIQDQSLGGATC